VVGVDGSEHGIRAWRWAVDEARRTGDAVTVVAAWSQDVAAPPSVPRAQLDAELAGEPDPPPITYELVEAEPGEALVRAARHARLLVVGTHGYGPVRSALVGSVSRYCIGHATCPVVVVPPPRPDAERD
jgi:nucleotide-binding universal stress UspA family protein